MKIRQKKSLHVYSFLLAACFAALLFSGCRSTKEEPVNEGKRTASAVDEYVSINKITDQDTLI